MRDLKVLEVVGVRGLPLPDIQHQRFPYHMGVELELENVRGGIVGDAPRGWATHVDQSLRNNGLEFVFNAPYYGDNAIAAVDHFYAAQGQYTGGARTSTHVHVNASMLTIGSLRAILALSYIVEDALFTAMKQYRRWCGYCMPLTEMSNARLRALMLSESPNNWVAHGIKAVQNADKYYGLNVSSLRKHGTLEFRYFPGAPTKDELFSWMDYCTELVSAGIKLGDAEVFKGFDSPNDLAMFIAEQLPAWGGKLVAAVGPAALYEKLHDLQCLMEREYVERVKRKDPLVFVSPQLIGLACRMFGTNKETRDNISRSLQQLKVLSRNEWDETVVAARYVKNPYADFAIPKPQRARQLEREGAFRRNDAAVLDAVRAYQNRLDAAAAQPERDDPL